MQLVEKISNIETKSLLENYCFFEVCIPIEIKKTQEKFNWLKGSMQRLNELKFFSVNIGDLDVQLNKLHLLLIKEEKDLLEQIQHQRLAEYAIKSLKQPYRTVLTLRYINSKSIKEISSLLKRSETYVEKLISKAIVAFCGACKVSSTKKYGNYPQYTEKNG